MSGVYGNGQGFSITTDATGNVYSTGYFSGRVDFDAGIGTYTLAPNGIMDAYITKTDASGNFIWVKTFQGDNEANGMAIKLDNAGNIYTTGYFSGTVDFDPGLAVYSLTSTNGSDDLFVCKLDASGNFIWARNMSADNMNMAQGRAISVDLNGNVYITGGYIGIVDFDPSPATYSLSSNGNQDVFILKLDASGNFVWVKSIGGTSLEYGVSIELDSFGNVYTSGSFNGNIDFDPNTGVSNITPYWNYPSFILKLSTNGNYIWAKSYGGSSSYGSKIALDKRNNIFMTGTFSGAPDFDPGVNTYTLGSTGSHDAYISKLDSAGNFVWAKGQGGNFYSYIYGSSISLDTSSNVYTTGFYKGTPDFDPGIGTYTMSSKGNNNDIYISKLDSTGTFIWAKSIGGDSVDDVHSITIDKYQNIYTTGYIGGAADFDPSINTYILTPAAEGAIFICKLGSGIVGIEEFSDYSRTLTIYPNPSIASFTLKSTEPTDLTIINALGETLKTLSLNHSNNNQISIEGFSAGIYFIVSNLGQRSFNQKIIVTQ